MISNVIWCNRFALGDDVLAEQSKSNQNHHVESTIHELLDLENLILYKAFPKCLVKAYDAQAMIEGSVNLR